MRFLLVPGLVVLVTLSCASAVQAQSAGVRGFVTDEASGEALPGVNVVLDDGSGSPRGAATDINGLYYIPSVDPGRYAVSATYLGYAAYADTLSLSPGEVLRLDIGLGTGETELDAVTVESERTSGAANVVAGLQRIRAEDIELVPTPDVSGDLASYLTTVPGVVATGDRGGQLFIRGGEPTQNLVFLDGIPLYQPFHVLGFYSAFPSDLLSRADLQAGGYDPRFGGQLSSVLDVATRNGNKQQFQASASVAPFVSSALLEGPLRKGQASFLASGRVSVIEQGASKIVDQPLPYEFGDVFGKAHTNIGQSGQLSLQGIHTWDRGTVGDVASPRPDEVRWQNTAGGMRFLFLPAKIPVLAEVVLAGSRYQTELGPEEPAAGEAPPRSSEISRFSGAVNMTQYLAIGDLRAGAFVQTTTVQSALEGVFQGVDTARDFVTEAGAYAEPEIKIGGLSLAPGLRFTTSPNQGQSFLEPRFRVVWQIGNHQLSGATGLYNQPIIGITDRRDATSVFTAWTVAPKRRTPQAFHAIAGYRVTPAPWLDIAFEGFYKDLKNLSVSEWTAFPRLTSIVQTADGEALGFDARMELRAGRFYGFLTYGLSSVNYRVASERYEFWFGQEEIEYRPAHDRRHQLNALAQVKLAGFDFNVRWQFGSGLPFSQPSGFDVFVLMDGPLDPYTEFGDTRVVYDRPFNKELPTYHRLDVTIERTFEVGPLALTGLVGAINGYDRRNIFSLDVFTLERSDQLPLVPTFGVKAAIGS